MQHRSTISDALRRSSLVAEQGRVVSFEVARLRHALDKACDPFAADPSDDRFADLNAAREAFLKAGGKPAWF